MSGALCLLATLLVAGPLPAETLESVVQRSDAIVLARCIESRSAWDRDGRLIVTDLRLAVERTFKGHAAAAVEVRTLGGRVGNIAMGAAHATTLTPGDRIVVLLRHSAYGPYFVISSASAGVFHVTADADQTIVAIGATPLTLDEFAHRIGAEP